MKSKLLKKLRRRFKVLSRIKIEYPYAKISVWVGAERMNYDYSSFHPASIYVKFKNDNDLLRIIKDAERCYILSKIEKIRSKRESKRIKNLLKNQL